MRAGCAAAGEQVGRPPERQVRDDETEGFQVGGERGLRAGIRWGDGGVAEEGLAEGDWVGDASKSVRKKARPSFLKKKQKTFGLAVADVGKESATAESKSLASFL